MIQAFTSCVVHGNSFYITGQSVVLAIIITNYLDQIAHHSYAGKIPNSIK